MRNRARHVHALPDSWLRRRFPVPCRAYIALIGLEDVQFGRVLKLLHVDGGMVTVNVSALTAGPVFGFALVMTAFAVPLHGGGKKLIEIGNANCTELDPEMAEGADTPQGRPIGVALVQAGTLPLPDSAVTANTPPVSVQAVVIVHGTRMPTTVTVVGPVKTTTPSDTQAVPS